MTKTTEQKIDFANSIDFAGLFNHAETLTGFGLTFGKPEVSERGSDVYIEFQSNNIAATCGIFGKILEYCVIGSFSNSVYEDEKTEELKYWVSVNVSYQHHKGGRNGMDLFTARYSTAGGWTFEDVTPRRTAI